MDLELINIHTLLDDLGIDADTSGKNVTKGWLEINCPFCADPSKHLGISPTNIFSCWRCHEKGNLIKLLKVMLNKTYREVVGILSKHTLEDFPEYEVRQRTVDVELPREAHKSIPSMARQYLLSRGFNPQLISSKYKLLFCDYLGDYSFRIIIPIFRHGQLVSFTTRDYSERAKIKYIIDRAGTMIDKPFVYNIDSVKEKALILEGPPEVWRFGDGAIATLGTKYTKHQVLEIARLGLEYAAIAFDDEEEAQALAQKMALDIAPYVDRCQVIRYESGGKDPAELFTSEEAEEEKQKIFGGGTDEN